MGTPISDPSQPGRLHFFLVPLPTWPFGGKRGSNPIFRCKSETSKCSTGGGGYAPKKEAWTHVPRKLVTYFPVSLENNSPHARKLGNIFPASLETNPSQACTHFPASVETHPPHAWMMFPRKLGHIQLI